MEEFRIILPSHALAPYVKQYWLLKTAGDAAVARTVPIGMMNLIFHRGERLLSGREGSLHPRAFLSGHESTFDDLHYTGQVDMISVVFRPAGIRAFFDLPMHRTTGLRLTGADLGDKEFKALEDALTSTGNDDLCILLIEQFLSKRLTRLAAHNLERVGAAIRMIDAGRDRTASLADAACLSPKQFTRIFCEYVGAAPKEFSRTVRFQRALHTLQARPQIPLTALAYECGYFDQSHMIRDFCTLSGYAPGEYLAACPPHSDYFS